MTKKKKDAADVLKERGPDAIRKAIEGGEGGDDDGKIVDLELERKRIAQADEREDSERKRREGMAAALVEMNRENCVVVDGSKTFVLRFRRDERIIDGEVYVYDLPQFMRQGDFLLLYANRFVETDQFDRYGAPIIKNLGQWWLKHAKRRQYRGVTFAPTGSFVVDGQLNLWRGWGVEPKQGDWSLMRRHISEVIAAGNEAVDAYCIKWIAWAFQNPSMQAGVAPTWLSESRGTGKSTLGRALCRIFGQHGVHISSPEDLTGKFNEHLRQCCFLFCDEAYAPQERKAESRLKALITEPTIPVEPKNRDKIFVSNYLHIMIAANADWAIPAGAYERRFVVQRVSERYRQDPEWFGPLNAEMKAGGLGAMLYDLLRMDLGDFHPRQFVKTAALAEQQEESLSPLDAWWLECLHLGEIPGSLKNLPDCAVTLSYEEDLEVVSSSSRGGTINNTRPVKRVGLLEAARTSSPKLRYTTEAGLGRYLSKEDGVVRAKGWRSSRTTGQKRGWQFPELTTCRLRWLGRFPDTKWSRGGEDKWTERAEWLRGQKKDDQTPKTTPDTGSEVEF